MHNESWAARWLLGQGIGSGNLGWPRAKLLAGPMGALGEKVVGVNGGGLGQQPFRVSQCFVWGIGLPGAGICGTGRGDWVPEGTPGKTPNVSHTLWRGEVGGYHTVSPPPAPLVPSLHVLCWGFWSHCQAPPAWTEAPPQTSLLAPELLSLSPS